MPNSGDSEQLSARLKSLEQQKSGGKENSSIDPTANVLSLVAAAITRQDDLRQAENKRIDDLRKQQMTYEGIIQKTRETFQSKLDDAEANRLNAITMAESRRIDALLTAARSDVVLASEKAGAQAATLAQAVTNSAEQLRNQVAAQEKSTTTLITQVRESLEKRIQIVEANQYQAGGVNIQRTESRQINQWVIGLIVGTAIIIGEVIIRMLGK